MLGNICHTDLSTRFPLIPKWQLLPPPPPPSKHPTTNCPSSDTPHLPSCSCSCTFNYFFGAHSLSVITASAPAKAPAAAPASTSRVSEQECEISPDEETAPIPKNARLFRFCRSFWCVVSPTEMCPVGFAYCGLKAREGSGPMCYTEFHLYRAFPN